MTRFLILSVVVFPLIGNAQVITGIVNAVYDGNTLEVAADNGEAYRVALSGIDCPELPQPYGREAKQFVESRLAYGKVVVQIHGKDRFGNYLGVVRSDGDGDIGMSLLTAGLAWTSEKDPLPELEALRQKAMAGSKGLWQDDDPVPPWIYRRKQTMVQPKSR